MTTYHHRLTHPEHTQQLGAILGRFLPLPQVLALCGDLGVGKTCLTQGIAVALGIQESVTSPTFTLLNTYLGSKGCLVHLDIYRLNQPDDIWEIGLEEYLMQPNTLVAIEWADKYPDMWPESTLWLSLSHCPRGRHVQLSLPFSCAMLEKELQAFFEPPQKAIADGTD